MSEEIAAKCLGLILGGSPSRTLVRLKSVTSESFDFEDAPVDAVFNMEHSRILGSVSWDQMISEGYVSSQFRNGRSYLTVTEKGVELAKRHNQYKD